MDKDTVEATMYPAFPNLVPGARTVRFSDHIPNLRRKFEFIVYFSFSIEQTDTQY